MKSYRTKKEVERFYLETLRDRWTSFPIGEIEDHEKPDLIIRNGCEVIGAEVTELHHESISGKIPLQQTFNEQRMIVDSAQHLYEQSGLPSTEVSIHFSPKFMPQRRDRVSRAIFNLIANNLPQKDQLIFKENDSMNPDQFPTEVEAFFVSNRARRTTSFWTTNQCCDVQVLTTERLQYELDKKEKLRSGYDKNCSQQWLFLIICGRDLSTAFEVPETLFDHQYSFGFDQAVLYRYGGSANFLIGPKHQR